MLVLKIKKTDSARKELCICKRSLVPVTQRKELKTCLKQRRDERTDGQTGIRTYVRMTIYWTKNLPGGLEFPTG